MKKKILLKSVIGLSLVLTGLLTSKVMFASAANEFEGGKGTEQSPFRIGTQAQLKNVSKYCSSKTYFKLVKNISISYNNFEALCRNNGFNGIFDGNNKTITLNNTKKYSDNMGLFGKTNGAKIYDLNINGKIRVSENSNIGFAVGHAINTTFDNIQNSGEIIHDGNENYALSVGGIVGKLENSTIKNSKNTGSISVASEIGGIVGTAINKSIISNVSNEGEIKGYNSVGGIVGKLSNSSIEKITNIGKISGNSYIGGISGQMDNSSTLNIAYNNGTISNFTKSVNVGGIVGYVTSSKIENALNNGLVMGNRVGGIVGELYKNSTIKNVLNLFQNIQGESVGLIVGYINGVTNNSNRSLIENAYTYKENSELLGISNYTEEIVELKNMSGLTSSELKDSAKFVGFDFSRVWTMGNSNPILKEISANQTSNNNSDNNSNNSSDNNDNSNSANTESNIIIKYNNSVVNVDNYLYKDRTYVDLYAFCRETHICSVDSNTKNNKITYQIDKNQELLDTGGNNYTYRVEHVSGSDEFKASILIGGRTIVDDENANKSDVKSCPEEMNEKYPCKNKIFYVPVRFLTQTLGLTVGWDGSTNTVSLEDNLKESYNKVYKNVMTVGKCNKTNIDDCTVLNMTNGVYKVTKGKDYYLNVVNNETGEIQNFSKFLSFYNAVNKTKVGETYRFTNGSLTILKNQISLTGNLTGNRDIAQVIMYKIGEGETNYNEHNTGSYPIVINAKFKAK